MAKYKDYSEVLRTAWSVGAGAAAQPAPSRLEGKTVPVEEALSPEVESILRAEHADPFAVLGPHPIETGAGRAIAIRVFLPRVNDVSVVLESSVAGQRGG